MLDLLASDASAIFAQEYGTMQAAAFHIGTAWIEIPPTGNAEGGDVEISIAFTGEYDTARAVAFQFGGLVLPIGALFQILLDQAAVARAINAAEETVFGDEWDAEWQAYQSDIESTWRASR